MLTADSIDAAAALWHGACGHRYRAGDQRKWGLEGPNRYDLWCIQLVQLYAGAGVDVHTFVVALYCAQRVPK